MILVSRYMFSGVTFLITPFTIMSDMSAILNFKMAAKMAANLSILVHIFIITEDRVMILVTKYKF